jgi:hypothetical protein
MLYKKRFDEVISRYKEEGRDISKLACIFQNELEGSRIEVWDEGLFFRNEHFVNGTRYYISPQLKNLELACDRAARALNEDCVNYSWSTNESYKSQNGCPWTRLPWWKWASEVLKFN